MPVARTDGEFRIGEGGLLRRFETVLRLTSLRRQIATAVAITWVPLMLLGFVSEWISGHPEPLLRDLSMHVRLLVAAPMFLLLDQQFPLVCRRMLEQVVDQSFVPEDAQPRFDRMLRGVTRLADSSLPELLLAALGVALGLGAFFGFLPVSGITRSTGLTAAQLWYALTDWPFFQFLLWRSLWRWGIWVRILIGLSRIDLNLVPTHPDRRGGISFFRYPSIDYCAILLFAISSVLCAEWRGRYFLGTTLASFKPLLAMFGAVATLIAFGPLLFFSPQLFRARRQGLVECDGFATTHNRRFQREWIDESDSEGRVSRNTQQLAAAVEIYRETVFQLRLVLFYGRDVVILLVATLLPVFPVMLIRVPPEDWQGLLGLLTGGRLN
jgi:hypothetical protein